MKIISLSFFFLFLFNPIVLYAQDFQEVIDKLKGFNAMRESQAGTLDSTEENITEETFNRVCKPVGMAFMKWGKEEGYEVRQVSHKYRNPKHAPNELESKVIEFFQNNSDISYTEKSKIKTRPGTNLFVRIPVVSSCLHCHGIKESRPDFIKNKYPQDKAHGFSPGDLRGMYSVFIPAMPSVW